MNLKIPFKKIGSGILISVRVVPRSSRKGIVAVMDDGTVKINLTAPPVDNAANNQLIEIISQEIGVRKSNIKIIKGSSSKNKLIEIKGIDRL